ncbi:hypothetical protein [Sinomonas notoginsengisoli]|nr:hypothetical protein [Sinomonas notoginsengisoli]
MVGLTRALTSYCGITGFGSQKATRNNSSPIDRAVDWSSKTW